MTINEQIQATMDAQEVPPKEQDRIARAVSEECGALVGYGVGAVSELIESLVADAALADPD